MSRSSANSNPESKAVTEKLTETFIVYYLPDTFLEPKDSPWCWFISSPRSAMKMLKSNGDKIQPKIHS